MRKSHATSPRLRLWIAGFLILTGALILASTGWFQTFWEPLNPPPSAQYLISRTYRGVLSEGNSSVAILLNEAAYSDFVQLSSLWTNDTPVTIALRNWNGSVLLQLPNCTGVPYADPFPLDVYGNLFHDGSPGTPTLTISRETLDVNFSISITFEGPPPPMPPRLPPYLLFAAGYALGLGLVCAGFVLLENSVRAIMHLPTRLGSE